MRVPSRKGVEDEKVSWLIFDFEKNKTYALILYWLLLFTVFFLALAFLKTLLSFIVIYVLCFLFLYILTTLVVY